MTGLVVDRRHCGPPVSGNGGWTAGALAALLPSAAAVEVTLRQPPPLETELAVVAEGDTWTLGDGVATARAVPDRPVATPAVSVEQARAAQEHYAGLLTHPFPTCFSCGPDREPGDGLRIFPGPVSTGLVAALWTPDARALEPNPTAALWASLDCAGGWAQGVGERPMVLGRMTAAVDRSPRAGEVYVVTGSAGRTEGRKSFATTTVRTADGEVLGRAEQVWIRVDPAAFH